MIKEFKHDYLPIYETDKKKGGVVYKSTFDQVKYFFSIDPEIGGEFAISVLEMLLCGDISSDNPFIRGALIQTQSLNESNNKKWERSIEEKEAKEISRDKLEEIANLKNQGLSQTEIGVRLGGLSQQVISKRIKKIKEKYPHLLQEKQSGTTNFEF